MRPANDAPTVRSATVEDAAAIARAHVESWRATYRGIVPDEILDNLSVERRAAWWREIIEAGGAVGTWVAELDGGVVGFVNAGPARDDDLPDGAGEVAAIYLVPAAWSRGAGRAMFDVAVADLAARGLEPLVLWVLTANERGRRFYESAGWQPDGTARMLDFGGTPIEEVRYRPG